MQVARGAGNARAMVSALESGLASSGAATRLLAVVEDPRSAEGREAVELWQRRMGYSRMTNRQVGRLGLLSGWAVGWKGGAEGQEQ